jgi:hypothetical protein
MTTFVHIDKKFHRQVRELLEIGRRDGFSGHPEYEEAQRAVLGEIQAQVTGAETWLEKISNDLYTAAVATQRTRAVDTRRDRMDMESVPVRVIPATRPPSLATSTRSTVQPSLASPVGEGGRGRGRGMFHCTRYRP